MEELKALLDSLNKKGFEVLSVTLRLKHPQCRQTIVALVSVNDVNGVNER